MTCLRFSRRPIAIDLFSGVGGFSLGFERAGFDVVAAVEREAINAATYAFNFPNTVVLNATIESLNAQILRTAALTGARRHGYAGARVPEIDVVIGGPPCQGFSVIGLRQEKEARNRLIYSFCRVVTDLRPRYFVMENVPGMAKGKTGAMLSRLLRRFNVADYNIVTNGAQLANAADFGVPQDRLRLFVVGARVDVELPQPLVRNVPRFPVPDTVTVSDAIGDLPELEGYDDLFECDDILLTKQDLMKQIARASRFGRIMMGIEAEDDDFCYERRHDQRSITAVARTMHNAAVTARFASTAQDGFERISRFHRLPSDGRANTIRAGTGPEHGSHTSARPIHPISPRVITSREAARLQSFPDWFRFHRTKWHSFRQIGNAVPPLLAAAIARTIVDAMDYSPSKPSTIIDRTGEDVLSLSEPEASIALGSARSRRRTLGRGRVAHTSTTESTS